MDHNDTIRNFGIDYALLIIGFQKEVNSIRDPKHKIEKQQELDKLIHYMMKASEKIRDLNQWFVAFGSPEELQ